MWLLSLVSAALCYVLYISFIKISEKGMLKFGQCCVADSCLACEFISKTAPLISNRCCCAKLGWFGGLSERQFRKYMHV